MIIENKLENLKLPESVIILGNFDGIHKGHQLLIEKAKSIARESRLKTVVVTFYPHPSKIFVNLNFKLIYTENEKINLFQDYNMDYYIQFPFIKETSEMTPENFIEDILIKKLNAKAVVVGEDYRFGINASGNTLLLEEKLNSQNIRLEVIPKLKMRGESVSSTHLRQLIQEGNLSEFNELTNRNFHLIGKVTNGMKLGRSLGFPTINLIPEEDKLLPPNGVYFSKVSWQNKNYFSLSNIGISPSIKNKPYSVETYIINFSEDLYHQEIKVELLEYLRPEIKFDSIYELKEQIGKDVAQVKEKIQQF